jgi:hypothetical protein
MCILRSRREYAMDETSLRHREVWASSAVIDDSFSGRGIGAQSSSANGGAEPPGTRKAEAVEREP